MLFIWIFQETSSKQLLDVTSCLFLGIFCKQCIYLFTKKSIKTKFYMDRLSIRSAKYLFWAWKSWPLEIFKWKACSKKLCMISNYKFLIFWVLLEHAYYLNISKRPAILSSKQIFRASNIELVQIKLCFKWIFFKQICTLLAKYA